MNNEIGVAVHDNKDLNLGPLPKVHERHFIFEEADKEFNVEFDKIVDKHKLTTSEVLLLLSKYLNRVGQRCVNQERKPEYKHGEVIGVVSSTEPNAQQIERTRHPITGEDLYQAKPIEPNWLEEKLLKGKTHAEIAEIRNEWLKKHNLIIPRNPYGYKCLCFPNKGKHTSFCLGERGD